MQSFPPFARVPLLAGLLAVCALPSRLAAQTSAIRPSGAASGGARATTTARTSTSGTSAAGGARQYRSNTLLGDATIEIDPETRSLIIVTDEDTHRELAGVIKTLDRPKPQVLIKVVFVEVTYNKDTDIGVEGNYTFNVGTSGKPATTGTNTTTTNTTGVTANGGTTMTTNTTVGNTTAAAVLGSGAQSLFGLSTLTQGTFVRVLTDDFMATLHLLETKGKVEILSRPSIMARNNQEAVIVIGQEVPFVTNSRTTDTGQTINTVSYDNVGIILRVTPFITSEGTVEMIVAPEISALTNQTVAISDNASAPVISKRSAETVVVTPNAQTVVIGGLMQTQHNENVQKIPLLGDIPYLGAAFRRTVKDDVKQELMIFLTPYIVNSDAGLTQLTKRELDAGELINKAYTRPELDRYLDLPEADDTTTTIQDTKEVRPAIPVKQSGRTRVKETRVETTRTTTSAVPARPRKRQATP